MVRGSAFKETLGLVGGKTVGDRMDCHAEAPQERQRVLQERRRQRDRTQERRQFVTDFVVCELSGKQRGAGRLGWVGECVPHEVEDRAGRRPSNRLDEFDDPQPPFGVRCKELLANVTPEGLEQRDVCVLALADPPVELGEIAQERDERDVTVAVEQRLGTAGGSSVRVYAGAVQDVVCQYVGNDPPQTTAGDQNTGILQLGEHRAKSVGLD